jgi:hypothetical protein
MFMASKINKRVASLYHDLSSRSEIGHDELQQVVQKAVKPLGVRVVICKDELPKRAFAIGGYYEVGRVRQPICLELFVSNRAESIRISKKWLSNTMFVLFQTLNHEWLHRQQYKHRGDDSVVWIIELDDFAEMDEQQSYLAELDEIDAYAHDIALELAFYHPDTCMDELRTMQSPKISSWSLYTEAFEGTSWCEIHNRLLKKVYKHLSQIREKSEQYSCTKTRLA